jgi:hypothetical protein
MNKHIYKKAALMGSSTNFQSSKQDSQSGENPSDSLLSLALVLGVGISAKKAKDTTVDIIRKKTALDYFKDQDLSLWNRSRLKDWYRSHNFYVTQFPLTHSKIFPLAVKILYNLIRYHGQPKLDKSLGRKIIQDCAKVYQLGVKYDVYPINFPWPYWILVADSRSLQPSSPDQVQDYHFMQRPDWNLDSFLNGDDSLEATLDWIESGDSLTDTDQLSLYPPVIRCGLFGIYTGKQIGVKYYDKKWFGSLKERSRASDPDYVHSIQYLWIAFKQKNWVVKIYDLPTHIDGLDQDLITWWKENDETNPNYLSGPYEVGTENPFLADKRQIIHPNTDEWEGALKSFREMYLML